MSRLLPKSLVGQMAVLIGIALLLAQLAGFAFALVERQQFNRAEIDTPATTRFTSTAGDFVQAAPEFQPLVLSDASRRGAHYELDAGPLAPAGLPRRSDTEDRMRQSLTSAGVHPSEVRAVFDSHPDARPGDGRRRRGGDMFLSARLADGRWINARLSTPAPPPLVTPELWVGSLLVYLFVLSTALFIATRIARPLGNLTRAAEAFRGRNEPVVVEPRGPADLRNAILAFNSMNERVVALLEEKDRTLGAIGHDLRTPLASLRIRAESVEPEDDRERMIATIEDMAGSLEDILTLARAGRSREQFERLDVSELTRAVVDDYRDLGRQVTFACDGAHLANIQLNLLRRALRNLVDNALGYAGSAEVNVTSAPGAALIDVRDRGPGIAPDAIDHITGAFYRGEPSRNRDTGGAGLGLSIAQAVVDAHGGRLSFANREGGGLCATISLPT